MRADRTTRDRRRTFAMTVTGPLDPDLLGPTLAHEHLYCDISAHSGRQDNVLNDVPRAVEELRYFQAAGGRTIIEATPEGIGRDPARLRDISRASGVHVVSGIAFYTESTYPPWFRSCPDDPTRADRLADYFVRHIQDGCDGVRAGVIGELASHNAPPAGDPRDYRLTDAETVLFQAAAKAQRTTGVGVITHASLGRGGHAQLRLLERSGADPARVCIGHCDAECRQNPEHDMAYYTGILDCGAFCAFDMIGWTDLVPDDVRADRIARLVQRGYQEQIVLSTDTCRQSQLHANGGRGYDYLWRSFLPQLRQRGVTDEQIRAMLVAAPRRLLTGV